MTGLPITTDPDELTEAVILGDAVIGSLEELQTAMLRCGRNAEPAIVANLFADDCLEPAWLPRLVPGAWCSAEWPLQALDRDTWRDLFRAAGYTDDGHRRARPRDVARLYRGADEDHRYGWSWTSDLARARWFAERPIHDTPGLVWVAIVEPAQMLAKIQDRREAEVVVDTEGLSIQPLEEPP
ncbi:hypothetical protein ACI798_03895 [Geodermatophilus sp. SYSU D01045]